MHVALRANLTHHRICGVISASNRPLEEALGLPIIDPTQTAVTIALGVVAFR